MTASCIDEAPQQALKSLDRSGRVVYVGSMSKTLAPGPAARLHRRLRRPDRRAARAAPLHAAASAGQQPARGRAVPVARPSRGAGAAAVGRVRRAAQAAGPGDLGLPAGMALDRFGRRHVAVARRAARHRCARRWPRPRPAAASSSSPATASSTGSTSRRASCGSAFPRSRCSTSSPASANSRRRPDGGRRPPEPSRSLWLVRPVSSALAHATARRVAQRLGRSGGIVAQSEAGAWPTVRPTDAPAVAGKRSDPCRRRLRSRTPSADQTLAGAPAGARRAGRCGPRRWPTTSGRCAPASKAAATSR